mmetsp:Transcript_22582/g.45114  ORF Transcript_22582/g.45114 Transcript_22582/m.45114 type:complete len:234 (-) Transcript_22582:15-716(-)
MTNMLMVTATMWMLHGVHGNTTHLGPLVALHAVLVVCASSLEHWLIGTSTTGNNAYHSAAIRMDRLLAARWQSNASLALVQVVRDDHGVFARALGKHTTVSRSGLDVADDSTLWHRAYWQDVANSQLSLEAGVHKLTSVHALNSYHKLGVLLVLVSIAKLHARQRGAASWLVDDLLHNALGVTVTFGIVDSTHLDHSLAALGVRLEHRSCTLTLASNNTTHLSKKWMGKTGKN